MSDIETQIERVKRQYDDLSNQQRKLEQQQHKVAKQLDKLNARSKREMLEQAKRSKKERAARTRRLIQEGAELESVFQRVKSFQTIAEVRAYLLTLSELIES